LKSNLLSRGGGEEGLERKKNKTTVFNRSGQATRTTWGAFARHESLVFPSVFCLLSNEVSDVVQGDGKVSKNVLEKLNRQC
jgi:hypothetical protein